MLKLNNIQLLRAIAALSVVLYHACIESTTVCTATGRSCVYDFWMGGLGVPLFFMISGFIMVVTSWDNFSAPNASWNFLRRRLMRIVPLYWLVTTIAVVGVWLVPSMLKVDVLDKGYIAASYLFWPVMRENGFVRPIANLGWTLNLEMMFYVVFSLALFFGRVRGLIYCICFLLGLTALQVGSVFKPDGAFASVPLNFWGDPIILNFIVGMLVGMAYRQGFKLGNFECAILVATAAIFTFAAYDASSWLAGVAEDNIAFRLLDVPPLLPLFVAGALGPQLATGRRWVAFGLLVGDASYSLYLIHPFVLRSFTKIWVKVVGTGLPVWPFTIICVAGALAAGFVLYRIFEKPLNEYFARRSKKSVSSGTAHIAHA